MSSPSHLAPSVVEAMELPKAERIAFCKSDRWIGYTRATLVLRELDNLLDHPKCLRMPCLMLVGRSGNGKTSILEHFANRHPVIITPSGSPIAPIVRIEMPGTPDETEFWSLILWACGVSHRERDSAAIKMRQAKTTLQYAQVRLLIIDEFNHLCNAGRAAKNLLAAIKGLSNDLKLSIVGAGTQDAVNALNSDPHMKSRFDPCSLTRWKLDTEYLRFLASYERLLPLAEPSNLASRDIAMKLYGMTKETIGLTVKILKSAAAHAIETGTERITTQCIDEVLALTKGDWDDIPRES